MNRKIAVMLVLILLMFVVGSRAVVWAYDMSKQYEQRNTEIMQILEDK